MVERFAGPGDTVIDATAGNGVDTAFLAALVGPSGAVYGFDIQEQALAKTRERLASVNAAGVQLFLRSHAEMAEAIAVRHHGCIAAIMFNLGYLPDGEDQGVITRPDSTLPALHAAASLLKKNGVITIIVYPGHVGGQEEADAVEQWASRLPQDRFQTMRYQFLNRTNRPPYLIAVQKTSESEEISS
jgi:SAM-dependent methyltransferase